MSMNDIKFNSVINNKYNQFKERATFRRLLKHPIIYGKTKMINFQECAKERKPMVLYRLGYCDGLMEDLVITGYLRGFRRTK